uniref:NADH-ubiquinone oxidoreductase chain 3 n=1 Tax=Pelomedusa subrufa TaxID=44522 RepID=Q9ZYS1_PELSU|nr:NADH dehydrogenase subunit 3 [Pelomedusa subrufa]AAD05061.1 NADH dehydrogenase subunit 3 [Pelomedusa subrufa]
MNTLMTTMLLTTTLSIIMMALNYTITNKNPHHEKMSPYECGFNPLESARLPFSIRFFLIAILFLLFDLEIALLLPLPWALQLPSPTMVLMWTFILITLLTVGFIYEWVQGGLEWPN